MKITKFDSSLEICTKTLLTHIDSEILSKSAIIRDINGQIGVIINTELNNKKITQINSALNNALGNYARPYDLVVDRKSFGATELLSEAASYPSLVISKIWILFIDRRVVGVDWLLPPPPQRIGSIPRFIFASIKGGVGRSTALCVVAAHLSRAGYRVLAIDFDLEAPGIGSMLLNEDELPDYGTLDFLVESQVNGIDATFIDNLIGSSFLGQLGARVDVIPAIGKETLDHPQNALAKIARAYLDIPSSDDISKSITLGGKLRNLVEICEATGNYDVILVDSRAGLHESTAAAMLALSGEVLLFGTHQTQTYQGYTLLLAHLSQLAVESTNDWRERLSFVHAKSPLEKKIQQDAAARFKESFRLLYKQTTLDITDESEKLTADDIDAVWSSAESKDDFSEDAIDCQIIHILNDDNYINFDPVSKRDLLEFDNYNNSYSKLINYFDEQLEAQVHE